MPMPDAALLDTLRAHATLGAVPEAELAWLAEHGVRAVVLRPDRYVMGVANTAAELDRVSHLLPACATNPPVAA